MPTIIQFFHPGSEHGHDRGNKYHKSWNEDGHRRKFISATGDYIGTDNKLNTNKEIMFWGEWEPDSKVKEFYEYDNIGKLPRFLHFPYIRSKLPIPNPQPCNKKHWQNTDPFVFGDNFKYAICLQGRKYCDYRICNLEAGTIIIFGSLFKGENGICRLMKVDTVFVVSNETIDRNALFIMKNDNLSENDKLYFKISFRMAFPSNEDYPNINKIYSGVKYEDREKYNGLFSFVPAIYKTEDTPKKGFSRIEIPLFYETEQTQTPFFTKNFSLDDYIEYWKNLKDRCFSSSGCIATRIDMPILDK